MTTETDPTFSEETEQKEINSERQSDGTAAPEPEFSKDAVGGCHARLVRFFDSDGFCRLLAAIPIGLELAGCIVITYGWGLMHKAKIATLRQEMQQQAKTPTSDNTSASVQVEAAPKPEQPTTSSHESDAQSRH